MNTNEEKTRIVQRLEEQVKILNTYIQELAKENESLQSKYNDMKTTLHQNKQLLGITMHYLCHVVDDYIGSIGEHDQLVSKLKIEVDALRSGNIQKDE